MNGHVLRQVLRQSGRLIGVLAIACGVLFFLILFAASSFLNEGSGLSGIFYRPPRAFEAFLGGTANFLVPEGWLSLAMTHPLTIALVVAAAMAVASGAVATEVERGTTDLVLARPVGRTPFLAAKAVAALVAVTAVEVGAMAGYLVGRVVIGGISRIALGPSLRAFAHSWLLFAALAMVALLASARTSLRSRATGFAVGAVVGWFFLNFVALLIDDLAFLRHVSPFHYFRPAEVIAGSSQLADAAVLVALGVGSLAAALWWFGRRDLTG